MFVHGNVPEIGIRITGKAAADLRDLAESLGVEPQEVVSDALRLLRTTVDNGLYVKKGRLTTHAPVMHAMGFWREIWDLGTTGRIEVNTPRGPVAFNLPREARKASHTEVVDRETPSGARYRDYYRVGP